MKNFFSILLILPLILLTGELYAQENIFSNEEWQEAKIKNRNGDEFEGEVLANFKYNVLLFRNKGDTVISEIFKPKDLEYFKYYDNYKGKERIFYCLPYGDSQNNAFFELIKDVNDFAFLVMPYYKKPASESIQKVVLPIVNFTTGFPTGAFGMYLEKSVVSNFDLFFLTLEGEFLFYGFIKSTYLKGNIASQDIDQVLKKVLNSRYKTCMHFAKKNRLNLNDFDDMVEILNYYDELTN